jgi:hypothetical protein
VYDAIDTIDADFIKKNMVKSELSFEQFVLRLAFTLAIDHREELDNYVDRIPTSELGVAEQVWRWVVNDASWQTLARAIGAVAFIPATAIGVVASSDRRGLRSVMSKLSTALWKQIYPGPQSVPLSADADVLIDFEAAFGEENITLEKQAEILRRMLSFFVETIVAERVIGRLALSTAPREIEIAKRYQMMDAVSTKYTHIGIGFKETQGDRRKRDLRKIRDELIEDIRNESRPIARAQTVLARYREFLRRGATLDFARAIG